MKVLMQTKILFSFNRQMSFSIFRPCLNTLRGEGTCGERTGQLTLMIPDSSTWHSFFFLNCMRRSIRAAEVPLDYGKKLWVSLPEEEESVAER